MKMLSLLNSGSFYLSRLINYPFVAPDMLQLNFTYRCNLRCKMCNMYEQLHLQKKQGKQVEINTKVMKKVIRDAKELKVKSVLFIGGEPLVKKDIFNLVEYTKKLKMNAVLVTNATLLNKNNIENCIKTKVDCLSISIDAATAKTFNKIRGEKSFERIINNLKLLNKYPKKPYMVAVCTVMPENMNELSDIVNLCEKLGFSKLFFQPVVYENTDQTKRRLPSIDNNKMDTAINRLIKSKSKIIGNSRRHLNLIKKYFKGKLTPINCYAGFNRIQVVQESKVYFCINQNEYEATFGDIEKHSLKELWYSRKAKFYRKLIKNCPVPCLQLCSTREEFFYLEDLFQKT